MQADPSSSSTEALIAQEALPADARTLLTQALDRHRERVEGIESFTLVRETSGFETHERYERREVAGYPVFVRADPGSTEDGPAAPFALTPRFIDGAQLTGQTEVDGRDCHLIQIEDPTDLAFAPGVVSGGAFEPSRATLCFDQDALLLRRITVTGDLVRDQSRYPVTVETRLEDYRVTEGLAYPFRAVVTTSGLDAAISEEERLRAEEVLDSLRERLVAMPEPQRRMLQNALQERIEQFKQILTTGGTEIVSVVRELQVNEGPPGGG